MNKLTVLLCEDSEDAILLTTFLLRSEGFNVEVARNTDEIPYKISNVRPKAILMDLGLPRIGGEAAIKRLKEDAYSKNIPVLLFSANIDIVNIAAKTGANGYVQKPFDPEQLISLLNSVINNSIEKDRTT
jgi:CheY-like chemotaxis protein